MRIALLTEGGYPYARGESAVWCDRLVRGLDSQVFEIFALSRSERQESGAWCALPRHVERVRTAPLWGSARTVAAATHDGEPAGDGRLRGRRAYGRFAEHFEDLVSAVCAEEGTGDVERAITPADGFARGLYGLAELARHHGSVVEALRSERAARILEAACRAPGALRAAHAAQVPDLLAVIDRLERALRPLSLGWCGGGGEPGLAAVDLCHAVGSGPAALPGLLAKRFFDTPLLVTEYGVRLREHYLSSAAHALAPMAARAPVRALLTSFQSRLARETYRQAALITPGNSHSRRWQQRCGADQQRLRTVYPGMDAAPFTAVGDLPENGAASAQDRPTLVWVGRIEPAKDVVALLHAFSEVRRVLPRARLLLVESGSTVTPADRGLEAATYRAHCTALAAQLFPDEAAHACAVGENPVTFAELGGPEAPSLADAYAAATVVVRSSVVEGFPVPLVEAMFCGRPTIATDTGAVGEVVGGTGLVVPPRNPRALADACVALLRDPGWRGRLGAAARKRAQALFTVEQNVTAFHGIYLELMSRRPGRPERDEHHLEARPFAHPPEARVPGRWAATSASGSGGEERWPEHLPQRVPGRSAEWPAPRPAVGRVSHWRRSEDPEEVPRAVARPVTAGMAPRAEDRA